MYIATFKHKVYSLVGHIILIHKLKLVGGGGRLLYPV